MEAPWYQTALFASDVYELNVRVGVIQRADHLQALVELKDPTDNRLIDMVSWPHRTTEDVWVLLDEIRAAAQRMLEDVLEPF